MPIWFCAMEIECQVHWEKLKPTDDPRIRSCESCRKDVHLVTTQDELDEAAKRGNCVTFIKSPIEELPEEMRNRLLQSNKKEESDKPRVIVSTRTMGLPRSNPSDKLRRFLDSM